MRRRHHAASTMRQSRVGGGLQEIRDGHAECSEGHGTHVVALNLRIASPLQRLRERLRRAIVMIIDSGHHERGHIDRRRFLDERIDEGIEYAQQRHRVTVDGFEEDLRQPLRRAGLEGARGLTAGPN